MDTVVGGGRGVAVATKVAHFKRIRLFPVLDRLVSEMLGMAYPEGSDRVERAVNLTPHVRREGRRNRKATCPACQTVIALDTLVVEGDVWTLG